MPNKTIYVSDEDIVLFDEAKTIAGEALSSVIARALREFVSRHKSKANGVKEIAVKVGPNATAREQRFLGTKVAEWKGFDDNREWWQSADVYLTQKGNWAVYITTISKASLLTDRKKWKESGDYLIDPKRAELIVAETVNELKNKIPQELFDHVTSIAQKEEKPVEYLDI